MKRSTVGLFALLIASIIAAALYFQQHQVSLMNVHLGAMSKKTKEHFWKHGIDCQEVYEVQGYEGPESLYKMFSMTQQQLSRLNPGLSMNFNRGDVVCVRGVYDISTHAQHAMNWLWPGTLGLLALVAIVLKLITKTKQQAAAAPPLPHTEHSSA